MTTRPRAIHQLVSVLAQGDAVGNFVRYARVLFQSWGFESEIFARDGDAESEGEWRDASALRAATDDRTVTVFHHVLRSDLVPTLRRARGQKALVFHNITPAHFFGPAFGDACERGRRELLELVTFFDHDLSLSNFNAQETHAAGFPTSSRIPFLIDWSAFDAPPDEAVRARFGDGRTNLLFVGRLDAANKRVDDLLRVFAAYRQLHDRDARLLLAGKLDADSEAGEKILSLKDALGGDGVQLLGRVSRGELSALFSVASAYVSMSEHEGFGVPLVEAMHRRVPVFAYAAGAVAETLGGAGVALRTKDPVEVASVLAAVLASPGLKARLVEGQTARLAPLAPDRAALSLRAAFEPLLRGERAPRPPSSDAPLIVCPRYAAAPEDLLSKFAARLAERVEGARIFTLDPSLTPGALPAHDGRTVAWIPDLPLGAGPLPPSTALQTAARHGESRVVFVGDEERALTLLAPMIRPRLRAWVGSIPPPVYGPRAPLARLLGREAELDAAVGEVERSLDAPAER